MTLLIESIKQITNSIWKKKSLLLTNNKFVKTTNCNIFLFNFTNFKFFVLLLICHCKRLLKTIISLLLISMICATWKKLNDVSNWHIEIMYASRTCCVTYCFFINNFDRVMFLKLIENAFFWWSKLFFLHVIFSSL